MVKSMQQSHGFVQDLMYGGRLVYSFKTRHGGSPKSVFGSCSIIFLWTF